MGRIVNKKEIAELFGVSTQAVDGWLGRGCPFIEKGAPGVGYQFDTATVIDWRQDQAVRKTIGDARPDNQGDAELRKTSAEASLAELKLQRELGRLVALEDVDRIWLQLIGACRARLLSIPSKISPIVFAAESVDDASAVLENSIHEALNELAANGIGADTLDGDSGAEADGQSRPEDHQGASEADSKPVGRRKKKAESGGISGAGAVGNGAG